MASPAYDNAFTILQRVLQDWGLESLSGVVRDMLTAGDSQDVIPLKLRETEQYKKRFAGNEARRKAGLPALSEAEYLATETQLKSVVRRYVGSGTYDTMDNLTKWLGADVSPQEMNDRFQRWQQDYASKKNMPFQRPDGSWTTVGEAWAEAGLTPVDALKTLMDPSVTEGSLKRAGTVYALGAEAAKAYRDTSALNVQRLGQLADAGVTDTDDTRRAFQDIGSRAQYEDFLARSQGEQFDREDQEDAELLGDQNKAQQRRKILGRAQGEFGDNYLGGVGTFGKQTAGQY